MEALNQAIANDDVVLTDQILSVIKCTFSMQELEYYAFTAAQVGSVKVVDYFISHYADDISLSQVALGAVQNQDLALLQHLIARGANDYTYMLDEAMINACPNIVQLLLAKGAIPTKDMFITLIEKSSCIRDEVIYMLLPFIMVDVEVIAKGLGNKSANEVVTRLIQTTQLSHNDMFDIVWSTVYHPNIYMLTYLLAHYTFTPQELTSMMDYNTQRDIAMVLVIHGGDINMFEPKTHFLTGRLDFTDTHIVEMIRAKVTHFGCYTRVAEYWREFMRTTETEFRIELGDPAGIVMGYFTP